MDKVFFVESTSPAIFNQLFCLYHPDCQMAFEKSLSFSQKIIFLLNILSGGNWAFWFEKY